MSGRESHRICFRRVLDRRLIPLTSVRSENEPSKFVRERMTNGTIGSLHAVVQHSRVPLPFARYHLHRRHPGRAGRRLRARFVPGRILAGRTPGQRPMNLGGRCHGRGSLIPWSAREIRPGLRESGVLIELKIDRAERTRGLGNIGLRDGIPSASRSIRSLVWPTGRASAARHDQYSARIAPTTPTRVSSNRLVEGRDPRFSVSVVFPPTRRSDHPVRARRGQSTRYSAAGRPRDEASDGS